MQGGDDAAPALPEPLAAVTPDFVIDLPWRFYAPDGSVTADEIRLLPDGSVSGWHGPDESGWVILGDRLCFTTRGGLITTRFDQLAPEPIRFMLRGCYKGDPTLVLTLERRHWSRDLPGPLARLVTVYCAELSARPLLGLPAEPVTTLLQGHTAPPCTLMPGTRPYIVAHISQEFQAASFAFDAIRAGGMVADIFTGEMVPCVASFTRGNWGELPFQQLTFFTKVAGSAGLVWWIASDSVTGKPLLVYVPHLALAVAATPDLSRALVRAIVRELEIAASLAEAPATDTRPIVAVLDMINNHGHQLINQLPAVDRLLTDDGDEQLAELWVTGPEFFGKLETIYPEFTGRIRRFASRWQIADALKGGSVLAFGIGSAYATEGLAVRLVQAAVRESALSPAQAGHPLIAFTLRGNGRVCRNLADVVAACVTALLPDYPDLGIVLDGWVLPQAHVAGCSTAFVLWQHAFHRNAVHAEFEIVRDILQRLPPGVAVRNLVGESMLASIAGLQGIAAYVAHVGTLQHKLAFLTGAHGLIHGPSAQLASVESGHYAAQTSAAPVVLSPAAVEDIAVTSDRGDRFNDYVITDIDAVVRALRQLLAANVD